LECRSVVGGACVTEEIFPGYKFSTISYLCNLMQEKVTRDLELEKFGFTVYPKDPAFFSPFLDSRYLIMWSDTAQTREEIRKFSARDAERYPHYEEYIDRLARFIEPLLLETPPDIARRSLGDWQRLAGLGRHIAQMPPEELVGHLHILSQSVKDFLDPWFESEALKVALATDGVIGTKGGPYTPGTAYVLLHHVMGGVGGKRGLWGFVRGGMGGLTQAMAASARSVGVEIRTGARVARILTQNGRANGVALATGDEIGARPLASNADPKVTFLKLLEDRELPPRFPRRHSRLQNRRCVDEDQPGA
jgi:phytoene dehydrogenase-like protein